MKPNFKIWTTRKMRMMRMTVNKNSWMRTMMMNQSLSLRKRNDLFVKFWQIAIFFNEFDKKMGNDQKRLD